VCPRGQTFVDRLLELATNAAKMKNTEVGTLFEAAAGFVLDATPGFEVRSTLVDAASLTDLLVSYGLRKRVLPGGICAR
jgi:hypothetical protein